MNQVKEAVRRGYLRAGVAVGAGLASVAAFAQETDPFMVAMAEAEGKIETYAGALVGLAAVAVIFMIAIKYVKKIPRAS
jgi:hypothetical protein